MSLTLRSERLLLRFGQPADAEEMTAFQRRNRAHFRPWEPRRPEAYFSSGFWRVQLAREETSRVKDRAYRFLLCPRGEPARIVGWASFSNVVRGAFQSCHLGFGLDEGEVGQGLMHEGLTLALEDVFERLRLHRVEANHRPENVRSGVLLKRLGFVPQGFARDYLFIDGEWRDHVLTARLHPGWQP
ncbi:MAG: GNAT family N-acetyltransferase [Sandaracinaceae bacterium]